MAWNSKIIFNLNHRQVCNIVNGEKCGYEPRKHCEIKHQQQCHYETRNHCETTYIEECKPSYNYEKNCQKIPKQNCWDIQVPKCESIPYMHCEDHKKWKCHVVPETKCKTVKDKNCEVYIYKIFILLVVSDLF